MNGELFALREKAKKEGQPVLRDKSFELLTETVKTKKPSKILEIGVNLGLSGIAMLLESENATLTGIEIDEEVIKKAEIRGFRQGQDFFGRRGGDYSRAYGRIRLYIFGRTQRALLRISSASSFGSEKGRCDICG